MLRKTLVSVALVSVCVSGAFAGANNQTGCGLGSMIITNPNSAVLYALQATTNGTSANQTFGITSGTLNCKKTQFVMNERAAEFVASNMDTLSKEISIGNGESLDTLAELLEVEDKVQFKKDLKANYLAIYKHSNTQSADVLDSIATF